MYCRVLACDFDGTGASAGSLAPEVAGVLELARAAGIVSLLVTGRVLEDLQVAAVEFSAFDAVVAENGAVVWFPESGRRIQLGAPPPESLLGELRQRGVPFHAGAVVVGTWDRHTADLLGLVRKLGIDGQLVFNREALMLLPSWVNKAVGVRRALEEIGRSERNMIAFGDAENDTPLLAAAEIGVTPRGAVPTVIADDRLTQPGPAGVAEYVARLLKLGCVLPTPARHVVVLGETADGAPAALPASGTSVLISGDPRMGKSWLGGLLAERLLELGYRLCVVDPEGDHFSLAQRPSVLALGQSVPLPAAGEVAGLLAGKPLSVVVSLAAFDHDAKVRYVAELLRELARVRAATGIPQWTIVDEAHYFFHETAPSRHDFAVGTGNLVLVTYRPSLIAPSLYASIDAHLVTRTTIEEERYFVSSLLRSRGPEGLGAHDALAGIAPRQAGLLSQTSDGPRWQVFTPGDRVTLHAHHQRKYADNPLPEELAFRFLRVDGGPPLVARNVTDFYSAVAQVPIASLRHHLLGGDFSRWASGVLGDAELARGLAKLEQTARSGATPSRDEILEHVRDRYLV
ncbi:MAG: HAD hydrolase family protein [Candidatus Binatia bacterium]